MALPQLRLALAACDRRDAAIARENLNTTHAAMAPLMPGVKDGASLFERCWRRLRDVIAPASLSPASAQSDSSLFDQVYEQATGTKPVR